MRILLAEDERDLSQALCAILTHHGYEVDAVYDGAEALEYLTLTAYDCAVLDIMMPKLDGLSVLQSARNVGCSVPVLMLTAKSQLSDRITGLDLGADDYMTKPFEMAELLARIRALTRRRGSIPSNLLTFGDLSLDREQYLLRGPAGETHLGAKEQRMMELLLENTGRALPADLLLSRAWGYDAEADVSGLWVYLSGLRKKIAKVGSSVEIRSIRGVGYRLYIGGTGHD